MGYTSKVVASGPKVWVENNTSGQSSLCSYIKVVNKIGKNSTDGSWPIHSAFYI